MKFPNHIILDVSKPDFKNLSEYWLIKYLNINSINSNFIESFFIQKNYFLNKQNVFSNKLLMGDNKYTIKYSLINDFVFLSNSNKLFYTSFFKLKSKVKNKDLSSKTNLILKNKNFIFDEKYLINVLVNFKFKQHNESFKSNKLWSLFDINFIRKEKIYTKLKYSRVPQYDIVSGGVAAIFAGFLGFLISEKFGIELVDSGDFYFLFMYLVFLFFFLRLFLKLMDNEKFSWNIISLKWLIYYLQIITRLLFNFIKLLIYK